MLLRGKKLGLLLSTAPDHPNFSHGVRLAEAALGQGVDVYLYCIDAAVIGISHPHLQALRDRGLKLFVCAYGARRRGFAPGAQAISAGLATASEILAATDRFVSFN